MEAKKTRLQKKSSRNKKKRPTSPLVATLEKKGTPNEILKNNLLYIKIKIWRKKNLIDRRPAGKESTASRRFLRFIFFIIFFYLTNFFFGFLFGHRRRVRANLKSEPLRRQKFENISVKKNN